MTIYRGLTKRTFPEKMEKLEVATSATCKLLQVSDDATFYGPIYAASNVNIAGQATVAGALGVTGALTPASNVAITGMATVTGTFVASATTDLNSCLLGNVRTITSTHDTVAYNDFIMLVKAGTYMCTITLATEYITNGRLLIIKDISGFSGTAATQVRVEPESGGTLDGVTTVATVKSNYGGLWIVSDAASWWTVGAGIM